MKKGLLKKIFVGLLAACMACVISACGENTTEPNNIKDDNTSSVQNNTDTNNSLQTDISEDLSESVDIDSLDLNSLTFKIDNVCYTLPCDYSEFEKNGWSIDDTDFDYDEIIDGNCSSDKYYKIKKTDNSDGAAEVMIQFANLTSSEAKIKDCKVGGITAAVDHSSHQSDSPEIRFAGGLIVDQSITVDSIIAKYGETDINEYSAYKGIDTGYTGFYSELTYQEREGDYIKKANFLIVDDEYIIPSIENEYTLSYEYSPEE